MAKYYGWWTLKIDGNNQDELSDYDLEYIANLIKEGYTSGQIVPNEDEENDEDEHNENCECDECIPY